MQPVNMKLQSHQAQFYSWTVRSFGLHRPILQKILLLHKLQVSNQASSGAKTPPQKAVPAAAEFSNDIPVQPDANDVCSELSDKQIPNKHFVHDSDNKFTTVTKKRKKRSNWSSEKKVSPQDKRRLDLEEERRRDEYIRKIRADYVNEMRAKRDLFKK